MGNNQSNKHTSPPKAWILTFGVNVARGYLHSSGVGRKPDKKLQKFQMTGPGDNRSNDTTTCTLTLASTHSLGDSCTFATRHTNTHTPPLSCGDIWRTGAWRENRFWEVRWGGGAGWLRVWGKQHLWVQRACLMCSLALTAPLGKTADDKLSGEVSYSCTISLPRSLALSVSFTLSSCPCRVRTAFGAVSLALSSLPDTIQPLSSWLSYHKLNNLNVEKNKTKHRHKNEDWMCVIFYIKCNILSFYSLCWRRNIFFLWLILQWSHSSSHKHPGHSLHLCTVLWNAY